MNDEEGSSQLKPQVELDLSKCLISDNVSKVGLSPFYLNKLKLNPPEGYEYGFVRLYRDGSSYKPKSADLIDTDRLKEIKSQGWLPVPREWHKEVLTEDLDNNHIIVCGLLLCKQKIGFNASEFLDTQKILENERNRISFDNANNPIKNEVNSYFLGFNKKEGKHEPENK